MSENIDSLLSQYNSDGQQEVKTNIRFSNKYIRIMQKF